MTRRLVIVNLVAGRGRVRREWPRMAERLRAAGVEFEVAESSAPGAAERIAAQAAAEFDVVIAAGGDGTVHEVVNGLLSAGGKAAFGVLPLLVEADGEIVFEAARRLEIAVLPGALRVLG